MCGLSIFIIVVIGLCWGSFLNVLILRSISAESILFPASKCPKCGAKLLWWHKIPIVSFMLLKGKCYFCKEKISIQYPLVELVGVLILFFAYSRYHTVLDVVSVVLILSMLFTLSFSDIKIKKISIPQTMVLLVGGALLNRYDVFNSLAGVVFSSGIIIAISVLGLKILKKETFGNGDIYLLGAFGAVVGFDKLILYILYTLFIQFLIIIPGYIISLIREKNYEILKYLAVFGSACFFLYVLRNISFVGSTLILTVFLAALIFSAYKLVKNLFLSIKTQETPSYCPLAPALALSCLVFLC